jgi:hypothetical protein
MKQALTYIAKRGISKWIARDTARAYWANLTSNGWTKRGNTLAKGHHAFTFEPHGNRVAVSHKRLEVALEDDAYANYGSKLPHPQL